MKTVNIITLLIIVFFNRIYSQDKVYLLNFEADQSNRGAMVSDLLRSEMSISEDVNLMSLNYNKNFKGISNTTDLETIKKITKNFNSGYLVSGKVRALGGKTIIYYKIFGFYEKRFIVNTKVISNEIGKLDRAIKMIVESVANLEEPSVDLDLSDVKNSFRFNFGIYSAEQGYDSNQGIISTSRYEVQLKQSAFGAELGFRSGFKLGLYYNYLIGNSAIKPFFGINSGLHLIFREIKLNEDDNLKFHFYYSPELGLRVYNLITVNLDYTFTEDDLKARSLGLTIGINYFL